MADASKPTYLERKALSAAGQWGRVKELPNGCWEWQGCTTGDGYAESHKGAVHRLIFEIVNGPLKRRDLICHACHNKRCVNPKHLTVGTDLDNAHDRRESIGAHRPHILTEGEIEEARELYAQGNWSLENLALRFGAAMPPIKRAVSGVKKAPMHPAYYWPMRAIGGRP